MPDKLPKYDDPPVVETVLGVQFEPLPDYTSAHVGWFWREYLEGLWPTVIDAPHLDNVVERFDGEQNWGTPGLKVRPVQTHTPRAQLISQDGERMVQIQDSRFHYNWRKREGHYPSYENTYNEFRKTWNNFLAFCSTSNLGQVSPNLWEVTYVNHVPRGELWEEVPDWKNVFSEDCDPTLALADSVMDDVTMNWRLSFTDGRGRIHIKTEHIRVGGAEGPEAIRLTLTARGPLFSGSEEDIKVGLDLGHRKIVESFTKMTSEKAHKLWKRRQ